VPSGSPTDEDFAVPYCPDVHGSNDFTEWATLETFTQAAKRGPARDGATTHHVLVKKEEDVTSTGHPHHQTPPIAPRGCPDRAPLTDPNVMLAIDNRQAAETNANPQNAPRGRSPTDAFLHGRHSTTACPQTRTKGLTMFLTSRAGGSSLSGSHQPPSRGKRLKVVDH
jgi:hypothetical protein